MSNNKSGDILFGSLYSSIIQHPFTNLACNHLVAVTGFSSGVFLRHLLAEHEGLSISVVIGMAKASGIPQTDHEIYSSLLREFPQRFECFYYLNSPGVHAKLYLWNQMDKQMKGFLSSANLSWSGLNSNLEAAVEVNPKDLIPIISGIQNSSSSVLSDESMENIRFIPVNRETADEVSILHGSSPSSEEHDDSVVLSLLTGEGIIPQKSGVNWGQRDGRNPDQAYIQVPQRIHDDYPGFFPQRGNRFTVLTDDNEILTCVIAQDHSKAIETPDDNSALGSYLRRRLNVQSGEFVSMEDLDNYGRRDVEFIKVDDDMFLMDFSN